MRRYCLFGTLLNALSTFTHLRQDIEYDFLQLVDLDPSQLHTHGAWYRMFAMEMDRLEREWKAKLPINSKRWRGRGPHSPKRKTTDEDKPSTDDQEKSDKRPRPNNDPRKVF